MGNGESSSQSSSVGLLPCSYRGTPILHGESLMVDECTTCECDNSTVRCAIKSCGHTWCDDPIKFDGQCCEVCPQCKFKSSEDRNWKSCKICILYGFSMNIRICFNEPLQEILTALACVFFVLCEILREFQSMGRKQMKMCSYRLANNRNDHPCSVTVTPSMHLCRSLFPGCVTWNRHHTIQFWND